MFLFNKKLENSPQKNIYQNKKASSSKLNPSSLTCKNERGGEVLVDTRQTSRWSVNEQVVKQQGGGSGSNILVLRLNIGWGVKE